MPQQCPKCGYVRNERDTAPSTECPRCGIVFSKFKITCPRCDNVASADEIKKPGTCPECGTNIESYTRTIQGKKPVGVKNDGFKKKKKLSRGVWIGLGWLLFLIMMVWAVVNTPR